MNKSSDLVNHPFRYRYRFRPQTFCDFEDSVNRPFALRCIQYISYFAIVIALFPPHILCVSRCPDPSGSRSPPERGRWGHLKGWRMALKIQLLLFELVAETSRFSLTNRTTGNVSDDAPLVRRADILGGTTYSSKKTCVRQVVLDERFPLNLPVSECWAI